MLEVIVVVIYIIGLCFFIWVREMFINKISFKIRKELKPHDTWNDVILLKTKYNKYWIAKDGRIYFGYKWYSLYESRLN